MIFVETASDRSGSLLDGSLDVLVQHHGVPPRHDLLWLLMSRSKQRALAAKTANTTSCTERDIADTDDTTRYALDGSLSEVEGLAPVVSVASSLSTPIEEVRLWI